jgi:aspartate-semialdehyde dehydrogenase
MTFKVAVVGATGCVGREVLAILADREFPASQIVALASERSNGKKVSCGDRVLGVKNLADYDFTGTDIAIFCAGSKVSKKYAPIAASQNCIVIDNSSYFRMDEDIPLIVPEVNPEDLADFSKKNIISNPNCSTIQLAVALKPLHDHAGVKRVIVSTYQSVSGAGKAAMDELYTQTKAKYMNDSVKAKAFSKTIAFNLIPHIGDPGEDDYTAEELKMRNEIKKIIDPAIELSATCVRVPVFVGHSESVNIELEDELSLAEIKTLLKNAEGLMVLDDLDNHKYITPIECVGDAEVFVSRIRRDPSRKNALNMWVVSDNLRKGAALNAVQIAELLVKEHLTDTHLEDKLEYGYEDL